MKQKLSFLVIFFAVVFIVYACIYMKYPTIAQLFIPSLENADAVSQPVATIKLKE